MGKDIDDLLKQAETFVRAHMAGYDPSHDWHHVERVRRLALKIAQSLDPQPDLLVVELAALFHDLDDKYRTSTSPTLSDLLSPLLSHPAISSCQSELILKIIPSVSYTSELKSLIEQNDERRNWQRDCKELHSVQDSDRLDAIGSIGIMRCAAFSCKVNRKLMEDVETGSGDGDGSGSGSAEGHFEEKLLRIRDRMKTPFGKEEAEKRHQTMVEFLSSLDRERDLLI
ncbi:uncharacterized protein IL334_002934 [Kwoniella shivajii]|uniref:HD/PDEase domain-containing protein n=1 Tax=Kwoniella shivajii TaxID=564305 RepID=A0ABZ1CWQ2_9TREE|nr:hypothetical protein IL334_002934 [Kwoniella shivajii]